MGLNVVAEFISTSALCIWSPGSISSLESAILTYVFWFSTVPAGICWEDVLQQITSISFLVYDKCLRVYNLSTKESTFNQDTIISCTSRHKNNSWKQITNLTITYTVYSNETHTYREFQTCVWNTSFLQWTLQFIYFQHSRVLWATRRQQDSS